MLKPSKYEYTPPPHASGTLRDFTTKVEITQTVSGWMAMVHITSTPLTTAGEVHHKLRAELTRVIEMMGNSL